MSFNSKLWEYATKEANEAIKLDEQGKYNQAINKYLRASEIILQFIKFSKNEKLNRELKSRMEEYMERAKILKARLSGKRGKPSSRQYSQDAKATSDKLKSDDEPYSEEEQELINTITNTILTESPNVKWMDIAGLENCKQVLREAIVLPLIRPQLFTGARKPWSGILLFGPPGCGKTLLAKAAATECKATFFGVSSADLLSKWLGESEKLISSLFKVARLKAPSLIFIDEIDSIATKRGTGSESSGERRVKTQLLTEIQGVKSSKDKTMLVLGATNRPWDLDTALLSRFEKKIYVPLPDLEARIAIFKIHTQGVNMALDDEDFVELGVRTEGYSGRDISNVCREVIMLPIRELDMSGLLDNPNKEVKVRDIVLDDFIKTIKKVKPMLTKDELKQYEKWKEEFGE
ncbi:MAG: AAA family ATPase [Promethearchaeota archaeon]